MNKIRPKEHQSWNLSSAISFKNSNKFHSFHHRNSLNSTWKPCLLKKNPFLRHCNKHRLNRVSDEVLPPEQENPQVDESGVHGTSWKQAGPRKRVAGWFPHHETQFTMVGVSRRMRTLSWVLWPRAAASSGAQSLFPSRGKASDRARLVSVRSVRVFPRFFRHVAIFHPEIDRRKLLARVYTWSKGYQRDTHGGTCSIRFKGSRNDRCVYQCTKCHGDLGTPARVSLFVLLEILRSTINSRILCNWDWECLTSDWYWWSLILLEQEDVCFSVMLKVDPLRKITCGTSWSMYVHIYINYRDVRIR